MKYYAIEFEMKEEAKGTPDEECFIPVMVANLQEVYEVLDLYFSEYDGCIFDITNIRPATEDEIKNCPHYYI
jgi:hypothetical protein